MEFRYRAIDIDRPPPVTDTAPSQSLNSNFSFFSARPILGCNIGPRGDYVREAAQLETEKEQIRQEIIAAETARRRELIAEVAQEMAVEREMAIKSNAEKKVTSLEEKLTMWITQRKLPNQNQNNLFRLKRTYSDPTMYTSPNSLVTSPVMQLPTVQKMSEATETKATPVLESNKEKLIRLDRPKPIEEDTKRKADGVEGGLNEPFKRKRLNSKARAKEMFKFWCDLCSVGACSETVMRSHELGKKHQAGIKRQNELSETAANVQYQKVEDEMAAKETGKKTEGEKKKKVIIRCETCNIVTYSEKVMETHKLGKKHNAMLKKQYSEQVMETHRLGKKPLADLDSDIITVPVRSLTADPREEESIGSLLGLDIEGAKESDI